MSSISRDTKKFTETCITKAPSNAPTFDNMHKGEAKGQKEAVGEHKIDASKKEITEITARRDISRSLKSQKKETKDSKNKITAQTEISKKKNTFIDPLKNKKALKETSKKEVINKKDDLVCKKQENGEDKSSKENMPIEKTQSQSVNEEEDSQLLYENRVKLAKQDFDFDKDLKDNVIDKGKFSILPGIDVWACDSISNNVPNK
uniref:Uncharacterized protein n=1 Tax=Parastrongyloides trichosuri TaxID=131310 RepID=A0A0N4ZUX1_PARTI